MKIVEIYQYQCQSIYRMKHVKCYRMKSISPVRLWILSDVYYFNPNIHEISGTITTAMQVD